MARILIVDDEESDRLLVRSILERAGHEIYVAEDGQQAVTLFGGTAIDVVVTDLEMPRAHGLELITVLREASPRPGIVVISGTGSAQLEMARAIGADTTLSKPVDAAELLAAITMVMSDDE